MRRHLAILVGLLLLAGCSGMKLEKFSDTEPEFRPEIYFAGETRAWGFFQDRFGNIRRQFTVDIEGTVDGDTLTMNERFAYADGERSTRVWKLRKTGPDTYDGTAGDVIGVAKGRVLGQAMSWQYDLSLPMGGRTVQVHFDDWLLQQDDNVMLNRSTISKLGIDLGQVFISFYKQPATGRGPG